MHIWAYKSLDERIAIRKKAAAEGIWPPPGDSPVVKQETKILLAAPFSPIESAARPLNRRGRRLSVC